MSASREKKIRQDLAAQGVTDPKKIREAEEKAKARKNNILYGVIAGVFVIVAAVLLVYNSGVLQRSATAVTINGEKYTAGQVEYFYANVKSSLLKSSYASFYGIDTSKSLDQQVVSDTMKTALGIEDEGDVTWEQYVRDTAVKQLAMYVLTAQEAEANGMGADEHTQEELDATMEELNAAAKQNGYSTKTYLKLIYGKNMTVDTFKEMVQLVDVATHYQSHYAEELTYTVSDLETYYQGNKSSFDVASYESLYFKGTADSTKDDDGNTVEPTDEENAAAKEAAEKLTQSRLKGFAAMNKEMKAALEFLNMPGIRFALKHTRGPLSSHGQDTVEFLISTNPGEEPKPLAKIASGGELSRIMLAFKSALADRDALPTVIYDEIDTGVSGLAAGRIGQLLHQTARGHQVLCITHTPQVAAFADNQLLIQKNVRKDRTFTEIHTLDMDGRVEVLARMISGDKVSELSLASARELIEKSK